jgi:hypothetical protein
VGVTSVVGIEMDSLITATGEPALSKRPAHQVPIDVVSDGEAYDGRLSSS